MSGRTRGRCAVIAGGAHRLPPQGVDIVLMAAGVSWDAVRAPSHIAERAVEMLGRAGGAVVQDRAAGRHYWFVPPGSADDWHDLREVMVLGTASYVAVPPADRTRGNLRWAGAARGDGCLTSPELLRTALTLAVAVECGPRREAHASQAEGACAPDVPLPCAPCLHAMSFGGPHDLCRGSSHTALTCLGRLRRTAARPCPCPHADRPATASCGCRPPVDEAGTSRNPPAAPDMGFFATATPPHGYSLQP